MQQRSDDPLIMLWPLLASILGLTFCAWTAYGNAIDICISAGCTVSKELSIGGISLWWFGCAAFAILVVLSFSGRPLLGAVVAGTCLVADVGFLLLMLVTASCLSCLIVAIFFALAYTAFRHTGRKPDEIVSRSWLIVVWILLMIANIGGMLRENMMPWAVKSPEKTSVHVYFSPTCPSCLDAVAALSPIETAAFFPISKGEDDIIYLARMQSFLDQGSNPADALALARESEIAPEDFGIFSELLLRFRLLVNGAYLARNGIDVVPVIEYKGLPGFLSGAAGVKSAQKAQEANGQGAIADTEAKVTTADVPRVIGRLAPGTVVVPRGKEPELFLGNGAFTYIGQENEKNKAVPPLGSSTIVSGGSGAGASLPINMGVSGACGGGNAPPCPE